MTVKYASSRTSRAIRSKPGHSGRVRFLYDHPLMKRIVVMDASLAAASTRADAIRQEQAHDEDQAVAVPPRGTAVETENRPPAATLAEVAAAGVLVGSVSLLAFWLTSGRETSLVLFATAVVAALFAVLTRVPRSGRASRQ